MQGKPNAESAAQLSPGSFLSFTQSPCSSTTPNQGSTSIGDLYEPCQSLTSPGSIEVSSDVLMKTNGGDYFQGGERTGNLGSSTELNVSQALRRLEEQLSLNDDSLKEFDPSSSQDEDPVKSELEYDGEIPNQEQYANFHGPGHIIQDRYYSGHTGMQGNPDCLCFMFLIFFPFFWYVWSCQNPLVCLVMCGRHLTAHLVVSVLIFFFSFMYFLIFYTNNCGGNQAHALESL